MQKLKLEQLGRLSLDQYQQSPKTPVVVVLDSIRSALNVGSIFRTADAFALEKIILCGISATPPNREITKTAIGATESVTWEYIEDIDTAIRQLKAEKYLIAGVEQTDRSVMLHEFRPPLKKIALIFGNEVDGIHDNVIKELDVAIEIPQFGTKHSLNVSVCAGIILWEMAKLFKI